MAYKRTPQGYCDNEQLNRALRANRSARDILRRILAEKPTRAPLYEMLADLAYALSDELDALTIMNQIRLEHRRTKKQRQS